LIENLRNSFLLLDEGDQRTLGQWEEEMGGLLSDWRA